MPQHILRPNAVKAVACQVNGKDVDKAHYVLTEKTLTVHGAALPGGGKEPYQLQVITALKPQDNSLLEVGSKGRYALSRGWRGAQCCACPVAGAMHM